MTAIAEQTTMKTFYCRSAHYSACINPGIEVLKEGRTGRFGEKHLSFTPAMGEDRKTYGVLTTTDPEKIQWIEEQIAMGNPDFFTQEKFMEHVTPAEKRADQWQEAATAAMRELTNRNKLLEDLRTQNPELYAKLMAKQK